MKRLGVVSTTSLFLLLGFTVPAGAQQQEEKQEKQERPEKQEKPAQAKPPKQEQERQAQPEKRQEPAKQQESKPQQPEESARQEPAPAKSQQQVKKEQKQPQQTNGHQAQQPQHQQQASTQRHQHTPQEEARQSAQPALRLSERGSGRISDARFHSNFGRGHEFHVGTPTLVGGYSRFHYGGYWFGFVEPWPADWYYTDDVYIDYVDGGYYMYNPYYPGTRFALTVVI
jgi:hypothetical protein